MRRIWAARLAAFAGVVAACAAAAQAPAPAYTVTLLPHEPLAQKTDPPASAFYAEPFGLNDAGIVVGAVRSPAATPFAYLWQSGKPRPVPGALKPGALARAVGPKGEIAGVLAEDDGSEHAFLLSAGKLSRLPRLPGCEREWAVAVNARGDVCGFTHTAEGQPRACLWPRSAAAPVDLHALLRKASPTASSSRATGLNDRGEVVGEVEDGEERSRGFLYSRGKVTVLLPTGARESGAAALNNAGQAAGWADHGMGARLVLFHSGKGADLGVLPGCREMVPTAINSRGEVVGYAQPDDPEAAERGWVWRGGKLHDLTALLAPGSGLAVTIPRGINTRGQIVASAQRDKRPEGVLLTPR